MLETDLHPRSLDSAEGRPAMPPPPPDFDPFALRAEALRELAALIAELERWRRRQSAPARSTAARWVFVRDASGATVRIRFEAGAPVQLRTSAAERVRALSSAADALDVPLVTLGPWARDARTLEWVVAVRATKAA